jgi:hypothetical protein
MENFQIYCKKCLREPDEYNIEEIKNILQEAKETATDTFTIQLNNFSNKIPLNYITEIAYNYDCPWCYEYHNDIENAISLICSNIDEYNWEPDCVNSFIIKNDNYLDLHKHYYIDNIYQDRHEKVQIRESKKKGNYTLITEQQFLESIKDGDLLQKGDFFNSEEFSRLRNCISEYSFKLTKLNFHHGYVINYNHGTKRAVK